MLNQFLHLKVISGKFKYFTYYSKLIQILIVGFILSLSSCATYQAQYGNKVSGPISKESICTEDKPLHTFYLIGDGGYAHLEESIETLNFLKKRLDQANEASTLLFFGDNFYLYWNSTV